MTISKRFKDGLKTESAGSVRGEAIWGIIGGVSSFLIGLFDDEE